MPRSEGYVSPEYLRTMADLTRHVKVRSYELMEVRDGSRVLDVGCGPGVDTVPLAKFVGPSGAVTGIDMDEEMIAEADAFAEREGCRGTITHRTGGILPLPFDDGSFDACHADRLFQVLPPSVDRDRVVGEMARVTRPGGRIVLVDTDWATASVDFDESGLERRLLTFFAERLRPNGFAGRQFYRLLRKNGLRDVIVEVFPLVFHDLSRTPFGTWLAGEAVKQNIVPKEQADAWTARLTDRSAAGQFFCSANMLIVAGRT